MAKTFRRSLAMLLVLATLLPILAVTSFAAVSSYTFGSTFTASQGKYTWYKISVPADGYLTASVLGKGADVRLCKTKDGSTIKYLNKGDRIGVTKGTYYFSAYGYYSYGSTDRKVKISFTKCSPNETNYCAALAKSLSAGTTKNVLQTATYGHTRWFKVRLSTTKRITIERLAGTYGNFQIRDSKLKQLQLEYNTQNKTVYTYSKQPAGTYYIVVIEEDPEYMDQYTRASLTSFRWK